MVCPSLSFDLVCRGVHGPGCDTFRRSQHLLLTHGFPPSSSASIDSNCCPPPAASHASAAAASFARNRFTSRFSPVAAALAGPTHWLTVGKVGRPTCTIRLWTGLTNRRNIEWHNQPMANATMIKIGSLIMINRIVISDQLSSTIYDE